MLFPNVRDINQKFVQPHTVCCRKRQFLAKYLCSSRFSVKKKSKYDPPYDQTFKEKIVDFFVPQFVSWLTRGLHLHCLQAMLKSSFVLINETTSKFSFQNIIFLYFWSFYCLAKKIRFIFVGVVFSNIDCITKVNKLSFFF